MARPCFAVVAKGKGDSVGEVFDAFVGVCAVRPSSRYPHLRGSDWLRDRSRFDRFKVYPYTHVTLFMALMALTIV